MKTLYVNGNFYTGNAQMPEASVMAVEDGRILWIGGSEEEYERETEGRKEKRIDLKGQFVCPGFIDSHMHVAEYGKLLKEVPLGDDTGSLEQVCRRVRKFIEENHVPEGTWVCGRGWNQDYFQDEKRFVNCHDLDRISKSHPIFLARACGHVVAVNSKAMELAGITRDTSQPEDGHFWVDETGEPLGIFEENAVSMVKNAIPPVTLSQIKEFILTAAHSLNGFGVTSVHTDDFLSLSGIGYEMILKAYRELEEEGRLTIKIYEQSQFENLEQFKEFIEKGYHTGVGSDYVKIGPLKMISDGSLGARTACLSEPYADKPDTCGIAIFSQKQLDEMISYGHSHGMQVAVHAIGDGSIASVIQAYEEALKEVPKKDHRHGIVHCQITTKPLLEKINDLRLHTYIQSIFLDYDSKIVESRVGEERAKETYQFQTLFHMGWGMSNGSDSPVEMPNVMKGIQCAVTRTSLDGTKTFLPDQALTVEEALASYTVMGAKASFEETKKGMLKPGMAADFAVLSRDPLKTLEKELGEIEIVQTYVDGICVWDRQREPKMF